MKKKRKLPIAASILLILAAAAFIVLLVEKDNFVIYYGINAFRAATMIMAAVVGFLVLLTVILFLLGGRGHEKEAAPAEEEAPPLSVKGKLQNESLRKLLKQAGEGKWNTLSPELSVMISQLEQMDTYQERLHSLLQENDVKALSDTEEVLMQAEQSLCQNVRRFINYMNVFDENDIEVMRTSASKTIRKNKEQLSQVRDFVVAVTDFVNQQGSSHQDPDMLNTYKNMILESLESSGEF